MWRFRYWFDYLRGDSHPVATIVILAFWGIMIYVVKPILVFKDWITGYEEPVWDPNVIPIEVAIRRRELKELQRKAVNK